MQQSDEAVIRVKDLYKVYRMGEEKVYALNGVSFETTKASSARSQDRPDPENRHF